MIIHISIDTKAIDEYDVIKILSRSISDPTFPDVDFKNKMAWVWTTLKLSTRIVRVSLVEFYTLTYSLYFSF